MRLIFLSGVDGSGKSTQAKLITLYLVRKNVKAKLTWMRWFALVSYPILFLCKQLGLTQWFYRNIVPIRMYWRYRPIAILWLYLHLLEYLLYVVFKILLFRSVIVADRFMLDVFVDVLYDTRINAMKTLIGRFFLLYFHKLLTKGMIRGVLMHVDADIVFKRRNDIPCRSYIAFRIPVYLSLARFFDLPVINGRDGIAKNFKRILKYLGLENG